MVGGSSICKTFTARIEQLVRNAGSAEEFVRRWRSELERLHQKNGIRPFYANKSDAEMARYHRAEQGLLPTPWMLMAMAKAGGVTIDWLFGIDSTLSESREKEAEAEAGAERSGAVVINVGRDATITIHIHDQKRNSGQAEG